MTNILWLRRDLQIEDNVSLYNALQANDDVQPVFIFDTDILSRFENKQDRRLSFIANILVKLHKEFSKKGGGLLILHGSAKKIIPALAKQLCGSVFAGEDYEPGTRERDRLVGKEIELILSKEHLLLDPREVLKKDGTPFKVFTPFSKAWKKALKLEDFHIVKIKDSKRYANYETSLKAAEKANLKVIEQDSAEKILHQIGYQYVEDKIWNPENAHKVLKKFAAEKVDGYDHKRNFPAIHGTSQISPYLRFGLLTIRQCYNAVKDHKNNTVWIMELIWREFYAMILFHFPETANTEFKAQYRDLEWDNDKTKIQKWKDGKTGYPIIDAGMRQLLETGWMHNRVRMIVASFLTKDLLINWRIGEEHFAQYLMDYEMASNVGGWQWASSTGTDSVPYFRIFNPELQSRKFDAKGEYIRTYVPELKDLSNKEIHAPKEKLKNYPEQIVDHASVKPKVLAVFRKRK